MYCIAFTIYDQSLVPTGDQKKPQSTAEYLRATNEMSQGSEDNMFN